MQKTSLREMVEITDTQTHLVIYHRSLQSHVIWPLNGQMENEMKNVGQELYRTRLLMGPHLTEQVTFWLKISEECMSNHRHIH